MNQKLWAVIWMPVPNPESYDLRQILDIVECDVAGMDAIIEEHLLSYNHITWFLRGSAPPWGKKESQAARELPLERRGKVRSLIDMILFSIGVIMFCDALKKVDRHARACKQTMKAHETVMLDRKRL